MVWKYVGKELSKMLDEYQIFQKRKILDISYFCYFSSNILSKILNDSERMNSIQMLLTWGATLLSLIFQKISSLETKKKSKVIVVWKTPYSK